MVRRVARGIHLGAAWVFVACLIIQVFLAGFGVFDDPGAFITHRDFGYLIGLLTLVLLVAAMVGRLGRRQIGLAVLLLVLFTLQSVFVAVRTEYPAVAALHPVNGFLILLVTLIVACDAWSARAGNFDEPAAARSRS
jgi:peptidoglycan/LPS O-acetylase OafA/YrhL